MPSAPAETRLAQIAAKLRTAARGQFQPFGVESHGFRRRRRLTEKQVAAFERRHAVKLPSEYRTFIIGVANGGAGPAYGLYSLAEAVSKEPRGRVPDDFLRIPFRHRRDYNPQEDPKLRSFWRRVEDGEIADAEAERRSLYHAAGTLVLCHEGCGDLHLLVVTGPSRGQMWVDTRRNSGWLYPLEVGFLDWYERWLDSTLAGRNGVWWHSGLEG
jgi:hypothetical protein